MTGCACKGCVKGRAIGGVVDGCLQPQRARQGEQGREEPEIAAGISVDKPKYKGHGIGHTKHDGVFATRASAAPTNGQGELARTAIGIDVAQVVDYEDIGDERAQG